MSNIWVPRNSEISYVYSLLYNNGKLFSNTLGFGLLVSIDDGLTWTLQALDIPTYYSSLISLNNETILGGGNDNNNGGLVNKSIDNGVNWTSVSINSPVTCICKGIGYIFAGSEMHGIFQSSDNGSTFTRVEGLGNNKYVDCLGSNSTFAFSHIRDLGFYRSLNGTTWFTKSVPNRVLSIFSTDGFNLFIGTEEQGVFLSTDNGDTWIAKNNGLSGADLTVRCFAVIGNDLYIGTDGGVYLSQDTGDTWTNISSGIPSGHQNLVFASNNGDLFLGTDVNSVFYKHGQTTTTTTTLSPSRGRHRKRSVKSIHNNTHGLPT